jgi:hypothetical protein
MTASDHLSPTQFGMSLDESAPKRFPQDDDLKRNYATFTPDQLTATQGLVDASHRAIKDYNPKFAKRVDVISMDGQHYLSDGHHRAVAAAQRGEPIKARVWSQR